MEFTNADKSTAWAHQILSKKWPDDVEVEPSREEDYNSIHIAVMMGNVSDCLKEIETSKINEGNLRGDTPLHLAARWITDVGVQFIELLTKAGANVNAKNKWKQTPLHYAVHVESLLGVECLLKLPMINVDASDINGYTPLISCFNTMNEVPAEYDLDIDAKFMKMSDKLVQAGASVNAQTTFGQGILHLVASRQDNMPLINYLILNFPGLDLNLRNQMGENFMHIFMLHEVPENVVEVLNFIADVRSPIEIKELLSTRDYVGRTPWARMIDIANVIKETVDVFLNYGISVNTSDNLGNTVLHRIAGVSTACVYDDILELLITNGANMNATNIFGESPAFVLFLEDAFNVFLRHKVNFNSRDNWGRTPLVSIMKHRPIPDLLWQVIVEGKADVNAADVYGSTPLHFAAYHDYKEQVEMLLNVGADINARDSLNDRPLDTVRRHCSYECHYILKKTEGMDDLYSRTKPFDEVLLDIPKRIQSSSIKSFNEVEKTMKMPENRVEFLDYLLATYYDRSPENNSETDRIIVGVNALVESLCQAIGGYDERFQMSIFPTGSNAEGTKVGKPDEFDFVLCIDKLSKLTEIFLTKECRETGFACVKFTSNPIPDEYLSFTDSEGYFLAFPFLQLFNLYLQRALNENNIWKAAGSLYYNYEDKMKIVRGKPVFNFDVYWIGAVYKQLKISIDLVPAVYKPGWWPPNIRVSEMPLMSDVTRRAGCFLILQTSSNDFDTKRHIFEDNINKTCNNDKDKHKKRMLRISATPAEIALMKSIPDVFRRAYALAKILKSKSVCPEIKIEEGDFRLYNHLQKFKKGGVLPVKPSHVIKSYMLKNCTFFTWLEMKPKYGGQKTHCSTITSKMCQLLLNFANKRYLNPFFLPYSDVFEFEKDHERSSFDDFVLLKKRELSVKLILGMLQQQFPQECLASKF